MDESTHFAPALRSAAEQILKEYELIGSQKIFTEIFGSLTGIAGVIDKNRQLVYANNELLSLLGIKTLEPILGKRPGEVISCIHSAEMESGCGTSHACAYCGAVNAILESQTTGRKSIKETQISTIIDGKHKSWDLNVISTPVSFNGEVFYILILQDISDEKRRIALERIFFHDLLNSMGALNGLLSILREEKNPDEKHELIKLSEDISPNVIDEIISQRQIRAAENGELKTNIELCNSIELLDLAIGKINFHAAGNGRNIVRTEDSLDMSFTTDKILLQRVIINLLKNALESTPLNGTVTTGIREMDDKIVFWVKNDMIIPMDIQLQLFQRSFSTKGTGRGLGTYSIRLLTENYLEGRVSFISNEKDRTVFSIELNKKFPETAVSS
jgi:nitrogen fixation/metabolism regulation signal transduction histidine kinase